MTADILNFPQPAIPAAEIDEVLVAAKSYDEALSLLCATFPNMTHDDAVAAVDSRFRATAAMIEGMNSLEYRASQAILAAAVEQDPGWTREGRRFRRLPGAEHRTPEDLLSAFVAKHHDHLVDFLPERLRREMEARP